MRLRRSCVRSARGRPTQPRRPAQPSGGCPMSWSSCPSTSRTLTAVPIALPVCRQRAMPAPGRRP
eukprot:7678131-Alexandrium_andersonii.AAC.1